MSFPSDILIMDLQTALTGGAAGLGMTMPVFYLGFSYVSRQDLEGALPHGMTVQSSGARMKAIAQAIEADIINIDHLAWSDADRTLWDATDIAEHSTVSIPLQRDAASALLMLEECGKQGGVFVFDRREQAISAAAIARIAGFAPRLHPAQKPAEPVLWAAARAALGLRSRASFLYHLVRQKRLIAALRREHRLPQPSLSGIDVLLISWATSKTFKTGEPTDQVPYLGRLPGMLRQWGLKHGFLCSSVDTLQSFPDVVRNVIGSRAPALMVQECLAVLPAIWHCLRSFALPWRIRRRLHIGGANLTPLLVHAAWQEVSSWHMPEALSRLSIAAALARLGAQPRAFVTVYENQPWEKLLRRSLRERFPRARQIAAAIATFSDKHIALYPSQSDIDTGRIPDYHLVTGDAAQASMLGRNVPRDRVMIGGALRHETLLHVAPKQAGNPNDDSTRTLLCCGDTGFDRTLQLFTKAVLATAGLDAIRLVINFHPISDTGFRADIRRMLGRLDCGLDHVTFDERGIHALLGQADLVLYGQTGSVMDAISVGVAAMQVGSDTDIDYDKLPADVPIPRPCSIPELRDAITQWRDGRGMPTFTENQRNAILHRVIAPLNEPNWQRALGLSDAVSTEAA